jgi:RNA polymerase sigma-70 factor (ECF subfamily)
LSGRQELERLYRAIARLPAACRSVFLMRKFDDMPQKAIAVQLRVSENTVEKRMVRALRMILEDLKTTEKDFDIRPGRDRIADKARRDA